MKRIYLYTALMLLIFGACDNKWDSHYSGEEITLDDGSMTIVKSSLTDYLATETSLSGIYTAFNENGLIDELNSKNQQFSMLVVDNKVMEGVELSKAEAQGLISDVPVSPAHMKDGQRLLMWNGKYLTIGIEDGDSAPTAGLTRANGSQVKITINGAKVVRIVKAGNGFVFELEKLVYAPKSMYEMIQSLKDDRYSMFKDMVLGQNVNVFDKEHSTPVGVDKSGNTVYDSVFVISNPLFEKLNIMSEFVSGTMLIPSNDVLKSCLQTAYDTKQFAVGEKPDAADTAKFENWIVQSLFFDKKYTPEEYTAETDIKSVYGNQWRTTVQKVDVSTSVELSNGVAYYVNYMKVPMNKVIYRIKHFFWYWDNCSAQQKEEYFKWENIDLTKLTVKYDEVVFTPKAGEWPEVHNNVLYAEDVDETKPYVLEFTALIKDGDKIEPALVPPGEYTLHMGFKQHKKNAYDIKVTINGKLINTINLGGSTTYHYDRGSGGYPEGFDPSTPGYSKASNYDRDGGTIGKVTLEGEGLQKLVIRIESTKPMPSDQKFDGHHWCLRPTDNNY